MKKLTKTLSALGVVTAMCFGAAHAAPQASAYQVVSGDSLSSIAKRHNVSVQELAQANNINTRATIHVGNSLKIPQGTQHATTTVAAKNASTQGKKNSSHANVNAKVNQRTNHDTQNSKTYTVRSGDTLHSIAKRNGTSYKDIAEASNISTNATLRVGQKLTLPQ
ncbi:MULTISPECIES: LysM peptidoglycan-binding domain-containing protein [unclassified Psychrobacter]|uniref:LysM peptidoglycan-binding domain-containing protein n=1 Tax=unclassified Psychrobacter TaxID=196806 RepID=UPI0018F63DD4|nr:MULTISPECIES: LysM peptidoglycan-binding domain-containing protein [unclassified Psychrobacter]